MFAKDLISFKNWMMYMMTMTMMAMVMTMVVVMMMIMMMLLPVESVPAVRQADVPHYFW